jgi:hypothetical protein
MGARLVLVQALVSAGNEAVGSELVPNQGGLECPILGPLDFDILTPLVECRAYLTRSVPGPRILPPEAGRVASDLVAPNAPSAGYRSTTAAAQRDPLALGTISLSSLVFVHVGSVDIGGHKHEVRTTH